MDKLRINYRTPLKALDLNARTAFFENGGTDTYDLIIGADGMHSVVRKALLDFHASSSSPFPYKCINEPLDGGFKVMQLPSMAAGMKSGALHFLSSKTNMVRALTLSGADETCYVGFFRAQTEHLLFSLRVRRLRAFKKKLMPSFPCSHQ